MKKKTTKITELVIDEENEALAIDAISLVTSPALEVDFVFFGKEKNNLTFAKVDEEKRELIAPALIPNKQIYRYDANSDSDYYVYFSKDTVKNAAYSYLKHNNHHKATYQHEQRVSGVLTVESWIKEGDSDKSKLYGFDLADGTWFVKMKIENDDLWQKIREGELKGLSIEGYFVDRLEKMNKTFTDEEIQTAYKELQLEGKIELSKEVIEVKLKTIGAVRGNYTKLIKKYNSWISENGASANASKGTNFSGDIYNIVGDLEKLQTKAKELGVDRVVKELDNDIRVAMRVREQAQKAGDILTKLLRLKA